MEQTKEFKFDTSFNKSSSKKEDFTGFSERQIPYMCQ